VSLTGDAADSGDCQTIVRPNMSALIRVGTYKLALLVSFRGPPSLQAPFSVFVIKVEWAKLDITYKVKTF